MSKEICNHKTEVPTGICLNDKDYLDSLLSTLKDMVKNYTVALTETSNEELFESLYESFEELVLLQREVFELAFKNGWYVLEEAEATKIKNKAKTLKKELNDLCC